VCVCLPLADTAADRLTTESVQGTSLTLQGIDDVHGSDGLALGVFRVGDGIADDVLKEDLEHAAGLLVDQAGDTLDTATTGQTANGRLGDALDVITEYLTMTLGAPLTESLASFSSTRHCVYCFV
jgi:hypothetical protein